MSNSYTTTVAGQILSPGQARGPVLGTRTPLSFWGGYNPESGEIIDRRHPLSGKIAKGTILALPFVRGSSTSTAILLEAIRRGSAPAALITTGSDPYMVLAAVVADELFSIPMPIVHVSSEDYDRVCSSSDAEILADGSVKLTRVDQG